MGKRISIRVEKKRRCNIPKHSSLSKSVLSLFSLCFPCSSYTVSSGRCGVGHAKRRAGLVDASHDTLMPPLVIEDEVLMKGLEILKNSISECLG